MTYTFTCEQGHEPVTMTVEAENDDEAMGKMLEQAKPHLEKMHSDLAVMSDYDIKNMIMGGWQKS